MEVSRDRSRFDRQQQRRVAPSFACRRHVKTRLAATPLRARHPSPSRPPQNSPRRSDLALTAPAPSPLDRAQNLRPNNRHDLKARLKVTHSGMPYRPRPNGYDRRRVEILLDAVQRSLQQKSQVVGRVSAVSECEMRRASRARATIPPRHLRAPSGLRRRAAHENREWPGRRARAHSHPL